MAIFLHCFGKRCGRNCAPYKNATFDPPGRNRTSSTPPLVDPIILSNVNLRAARPSSFPFVHSFAAMDVLPAELHDSILDFLIGDLRTLKACCITCKLWLPRAQRNLHLRVIVNQKNINSIHATLCRQPHLATVVQELTLNSIDGTNKPPKDLRLTSLRRLRLVDMDLSNSWVNAAVFRAAPSLTEFSLRACHADEPTTFLTIIGALPHLLHLDIEHCWSSSYGASPIPDIDAPKLRSLSLVNYASLNIATATVFEACLEYPAAFSKLRILDIRLPAGYADPFDRFLQTVGPSLRELTIGVRPEAVLMRE